MKRLTSLLVLAACHTEQPALELARGALTEIPLGGPGPDAGHVPGDQTQLVVAESDAGWLAVWTDERAFSLRGTDIYAARIAPDGGVLDPFGILIAGTERDETWPAVAFDGQQWVVGWIAADHWRGHFISDLHAAFVSPLGQVTRLPAALGGNQREDLRGTSAASHGGDTWLSWMRHTELKYAVVRADGGVVPETVVAGVNVVSGTHTALAWNGDSFLLAWGNGGLISAMRFGPDGGVLASPVTIDDGTGSQSIIRDLTAAPRAADDSVALVWSNVGNRVREVVVPAGAPLPTSNLEMQGAIAGLTHSSAAIDSAGFIAVWSFDDGRLFSTAFTGSSFTSATTLAGASNVLRPVLGAGPRLFVEEQSGRDIEVMQSAFVSSPVFTALGVADSNWRVAPVASELIGGNHALAWGHAPSRGSGTEVANAVLSGNTPSAGASFGRPSHDASPRLARVGSVVYLAYAVRENTVAVDVASLNQAPFARSLTMFTARDPDIAANADNAVLIAGRTDQGLRLILAFAVGGPPLQFADFDPGAQMGISRIATNGVDYLVAAEACRDSTVQRCDIELAFVRPVGDGGVPSMTALQGCSATNGDQREPSLAADDAGNFLVAWSDVDGLRGALVLADGGYASDACGFPITGLGAGPRRSAVGWAREQFVVAWDEGDIQTGPNRIRYTSVYPGGVVVDHAGKSLSDGGTIDFGPALAGGGTYVLATFSRWNEPMRHVAGIAERIPVGAPLGASCDAGAACSDGFCANGVCCDRACDLCEACSAAGQCHLRSNGAECRSRTSYCDLAETCTGFSPICPSDVSSAENDLCGPTGVEGTCSASLQCVATDGGVLSLDAGSGGGAGGGSGGAGGGTAGGGTAGGASTAGGTEPMADAGVSYSHYSWSQPACHCSSTEGSMGLLLLASTLLRRRRARALLLLPLLLIAGVASAEPRLKLALPGMQATEGVSKAELKTLDDYVQTRLGADARYELVTPGEISALIGMERQRQLTGCADDTSCIVEMANALAAERLLLGSVSKAGGSYVVSFTLLDAKSGAALGRSGSRLKAAGIDDVLDAVPALLDEVLGRDVKAQPTASPATRPAFYAGVLGELDILGVAGGEPAIAPGISVGLTYGRLGATASMLIVPTPGFRLVGRVTPLPDTMVQPWLELGATVFGTAVGLRAALACSIALTAHLIAAAHVGVEGFVSGNDDFERLAVLAGLDLGWRF